MWQLYSIKGNVLEEKEAKIFNQMGRGTYYLISKTRAVSTLGRREKKYKKFRRWK